MNCRLLTIVPLIILLAFKYSCLHATIIVALHTKEGIVIAADSRATIRSGNKTTYQDSVVKLIPKGNCVVAFFGTFGMSGDNLDQLLMDLDIRDKNKFPNINILGEFYAIENKCWKLFEEKYYKWVSKDPTVEGGFFVAGNIKGQPTIRTVHIDPSKRRCSLVMDSVGIIFKGQTDIISRLLYGIAEDAFVIDVGLASDRDLIDNYLGINRKLYDKLKSFKYKIDYRAMSLDEGIEFSKFLVEATIIMNKYSHGTDLYPRSGDSGVGGAIYIITITKEGLSWVK